MTGSSLGRGRRRARGWVWTLAALLLGSGALAQEREAVYGIWATSGTMIEVKPDGDGLSAVIVALKNPNWREKDGVGVVGQPKSDLHNPDEALRERPLLGLEMLSDYRWKNGRWQGKLYLPSKGTIWKSNVGIKGGQLRIRGYVGLSVLGKTQSFAPLASCNDDILKMIRTAGMTNTPCGDRTAGRVADLTTEEE